MPFNLDLIGVETSPVEFRWTERDTMLYALGVGAGMGDPSIELSFTTQNSRGVAQRVLPTYAVVAAPASLPEQFGELPLSKVLHGEQGITLHRPLPAAGALWSSSTVTGMYDKGSGALIRVRTLGRDREGKLVVESRLGIFVRDAGGFGGDRGPPSGSPCPSRDPDRIVTYTTRKDQALLYRLSGDYNPLHSDPAFAREAGFERPILHGLCTYGFAGRALLQSLCAGEPERVKSLDGRFRASVYPGDAIAVSIWQEGAGQAAFNVSSPDGTVVLDRGRLVYEP
jgi:acyl dehydratase